MKKIYSTLLSVVLCASTITAADSVFKATATKDASAFQKTELNSIKSKNINNYEPVSTPAKAPAKAPASGEWKVSGQGIWVEGPFDMFSDIKSGQKWNVNIEENSENPGWYRILPYADPKSPISSMLGKGDTSNYIYINATNPDKVYLEPFKPFGQFQFYQLVPESQVFGNNYSEYGTLKDNVIKFPAQSFAYVANNQPSFANVDGKFQIVLPGGELKDYSIQTDSPFCADNNNIVVKFTLGEDAASLKAIILPGMYVISGNEQVVATMGQAVPLTNNAIAVDASNMSGINTMLLVSLAADGSIGEGTEVHFFGTSNDDGNWATIGEGTYAEAIYSSAYKDIAAETLKVTIQENNKHAGYFRLVNPYATSSKIPSDALISHSDHNHYIYINATDPTKVYIEVSPIGVNYSGEAAIYSIAGVYIDGGEEISKIPANYFGSYANRKITMPDGTLLHAEKYWQNGSFLSSGKNFVVTLPSDYTSVEGVAVDNDANAPVEYFNLQGVRVANPEAGQLVIKRQGSTVTKMVF